MIGNHRGSETQRDELTERIIGFGIDVHRALGPGLLESAYEACLCHELASAKLGFARQAPLPVLYKGLKLDCGYRIDLVIESKLVVELKTVERLTTVHEAQLLTYLKLGGYRTGLLMNFNVAVLKDGLRRMML